ncbi:MAG: hypothetical protein US42_C0011G0032 [Candidatus Magasanikbacteria bacterium GW2011_GWC2_37_14]|uniref:Glycosyltransferase RgtA/B/C/D-like domain-containing protein n=1 Tax=Candidatus Magasanikbacteria bacterium GW2011_GWC2_37_14 TaxID=1619046 RepID=A0A0G0IT11_9BACT|nr:MAG: hypothetical protein US42_C0011G0032 [Candidatus Magasanikbacteria bacterium GW2011_GWC2_37_14]
MLQSKYWRLLGLLVTLFLLYFQLLFWHNLFVGLLSVICYLFIVVPYWQTIWRRVLAINNTQILNKVFSLFTVFNLLAIFSAIFIIYYTLTSFLIWLCFILTAIVSLLFYNLNKKKIKEPENSFESENEEIILFGKPFWFLILYLVVFIGALFVLHSKQASGVLLSPWQEISVYFLPLFFVSLILSGIFLFSKFSLRTILWILVFQSFLLHVYLPMSHLNPWGGDVWRHVAVENKIINGGLELPVLVGESAKWREVVGVDLPEAFLIPHKYSYGYLWGTTVLLSETLSISVLNINLWLMPILWSLFTPFLFYRLGSLIFNSRRKGLWLVWLSFLPFPLQAMASFTLPVSLGFLGFLFVLILWLQYWRDHYRSQKRLAMFLSVLMIFNYSLYFILTWIFVLFGFIVNYLKHNQENSLKNKISWTVLIFASIFIIPIIELVSKISFTPENFNLWQNFKQLLGQFSGWFTASAVRPHDILSGNLIFNHTPDYAFVGNIFNVWRWWLIPAMIILWLFVGGGIYKIFKNVESKIQTIGLLFSTVFGGYLIGWFVLDGDRLFTRRLDMVLSLLLIIFVIQGIIFLIEKISKYSILNIKYFKKIILIIFVIIFSWFVTFTYASGPDSRVVSKDELAVANYLWNDETKTHPASSAGRPNPPLVGEGNMEHCILADTWVLLPLEAVSAKQIVGGGFPIDAQFGQPELTIMYNEMLNNPRESILKLAHEKTRSENCWFVSGQMTEDLRHKNGELFGSQPVEIGNLFVWQEDLKKNTK